MCCYYGFLIIPNDRGSITANKFTNQSGCLSNTRRLPPSSTTFRHPVMTVDLRCDAMLKPPDPPGSVNGDSTATNLRPEINLADV